MKVYKTEIDRTVDLDELLSGPGIVPQDGVEVETEWELLEGGKMKMAEAEVGDNDKAVIRRYEFFKYTGPYDSAHEPTSLFLDTELLAPPDGELGDFIAANMVAANLVAVPEPATWLLLLTGLTIFGWRRRSRPRTVSDFPNGSCTTGILEEWVQLLASSFRFRPTTAAWSLIPLSIMH